jgi:hypothetical protein
MKKNYRNVVEQIIIDDTYYIKKFKWTIIDDDNKEYAKGEADSLQQALEEGRKRLKKL